jgi:hypothetical protein
MAEIDLIPTDYRNRIWLLGRARAVVSGALALGLLQLVLAGLIHYRSGALDARVAALESRQAITQQQRAKLEQLDNSREDLENRLALLAGLRGGAAARDMFEAVDRAMVKGEVWFLDWEFNRDGSVVEPPKQTGSNGYFIVIPAGAGEKTTAAWKIDTNMRIRGQASDHSALSRFVRRMYQQPEIQDVRIIDTVLAANSRNVNFNLAVTVNTRAGSS